MHRSYNIPLNDSSMMDFSSSPQSTYLPNFLCGNNSNFNDSSSFINHSKIPQNSMQSFLKKSPTSNLKHNESFHDRSRKNGPPIITLRNASPISPYMKNLNLGDDNSNHSTSFVKQNYMPYNRNFSAKGFNTSLKESEAYSRFLSNEIKANGDADYENWVTVFGYTSNDARFVFNYFSEIGTIIESKISNTVNWMHLHYASRMHALAALNRNGRIINTNMMIGVKPCDDKSVDIPLAMTNDLSRQENFEMTNTISDNTDSFYGREVSRNPIEKRGFNHLNGSIRYLRAESPKPEPEEEPQEQRGGLLRRAMSMVFGRS